MFLLLFSSSHEKCWSCRLPRPVRATLKKKRETLLTAFSSLSSNTISRGIKKTRHLDKSDDTKETIYNIICPLLQRYSSPCQDFVLLAPANEKTPRHTTSQEVKQKNILLCCPYFPSHFHNFFGQCQQNKDYLFLLSSVPEEHSPWSSSVQQKNALT